ncbi:MAG: peptide chain release factor N(5)-glutamine methyltransferase, partial [Burkholderiaceae bacterium]|nr:peptide chain release factor N(5)-glutamine methyltransferase [Burkholderiaceae bacterium]
MATIKEVLFKAAHRIDRFEARLLLAHLLQCRREYFITHDNDEITDDVRQKYDTLIARREAGEPVPYIIGEQEFFSRP